MKDIITVIKFTMKDMVKRKSFIISTLIILVLIVLGFNVPNIIKSIKGEDSEDKLLIVDNENIILAQPIERHGDEVQHWKVDSENNKIIKICEIIKKQLEVGHINIAIITKDFNESIELHKEITNYGVNAELISENLDKYTGGVIVIPSYLSKGLEFDSVIISDSKKYSENTLDIKLLYVACTRAMHTLDIISK